MVYVIVAVILAIAVVALGAVWNVASFRGSRTSSYAPVDTDVFLVQQRRRVLLVSGIAVVASGLVLSAAWVQYKDVENLRDELEHSDIGGLTHDLKNLSNIVQDNANKDAQNQALLETHGVQLTALTGTCYVCNNLIENPLYACWDSNQDGLCTLPGEDKNGDGNCTSLDCQGVDGHACWDLDADRVCDLLTEDKNLDGYCTVADCQGTPGTNGTNGIDGNHGSNGSHGYHCWDLNENRLCDLVTEDLNQDGNCTVADCVHYANGSIELVNPQGAYIDFKLLEDTDYDVRLQHVQHGFHLTTGGSGNAKLGMVLDANGRLGIGARTPSYDVHVVDDTTGYNQIRVHSNHSEGRAGISLYQNSASSDFVMQHSTLGAGFLHNRGGNLTIMAESLHLFSNDVPTVEAIHIASSGAIGFGTKHSGVYPYKFGGTVYTPTLVTSICTTSTISSQTSELALQSGATPGAGAEITLFGDGTQSNSAFYDSGYHKFRGLNGNVGTGKIEVHGNDESLQLYGVDHVYMAWYKAGAGGGRSAWMGYGGAGQSLLQIANQVSGGGLNLATTGGTVYTNSPLDVTGDIIVSGTVDGVDIAAHKADYDSKVNQDVRTTASPYFATLSVNDPTPGNYEFRVNGKATFGDTYDAAAYGQIQIVRPASQGTSFHQSFIRAGNAVLGLGFLNASSTFGIHHGLDNTGSTGIFIEQGGEVGIGNRAPDYKLHVTGTIAADSTSSEQLRLRYDASNYVSIQSANGGGVYFTAIGTSYPSFHFNADMYVNSVLLATHTSTPQLWARYDGSNYMTIHAFNGGAVNFDAVGTGSTYFVFKDDTYVEGALIAASTATSQVQLRYDTNNYMAQNVGGDGVFRATVVSSTLPDAYYRFTTPSDTEKFFQIKVFDATGGVDLSSWSGYQTMSGRTTFVGGTETTPVYVTSTQNDVRIRIDNDARGYSIKVRDVGTGDDRFIIGDETAGQERLLMTGDGDITTTGAVNHVSTHPLPNGGSGRWIWLGQLSAMDQGGRSATIHIVSNQGYHVQDYLDHEVFIRFKTFNEPASGRRFSVNYYSTGMNSAFSSGIGSRVAVHNVSYTSYNFYIYLEAYCGDGAYYTVQHNSANARWTHNGADTTPHAAAYYAPSWYVVQSNSIINADLSVNGNIAVTGTVDGVDLSTFTSGTWSHSVVCVTACSGATNSEITYMRSGSWYTISGKVQVTTSGSLWVNDIIFSSLPVTIVSCRGTVSGHSDTQSFGGEITCTPPAILVRGVTSSMAGGKALYVAFTGIIET